MPEQEKTLTEWFQDAVEIMARLRAPGGCPWDREQSHESLKKYLIEESYELLEAVDACDDKAIMEECGDVLLQVLFHADIAREEGRFDIADVIECLCEKLISRHPHVFGDVEADTAAEVLDRWEKLKRTEKPERTSILDGIPKDFPALMKAEKTQKRAAKVGFDWQKIDEVFDKFEEEWGEFRRAYTQEDPAQMEEEMGDLFFALVNVSRYVKVHPEEALQKTNKKFNRRFRYIEEKLAARNKTVNEATLEEMDALWDEAKLLEKKG
ncbi:nucleoside triphosphate pyrophosphohydrolase [bacterium]|nr:nucleoside triphosphate pyrophosphohydrolase [bacterium]